jgi:hypothetical protein
MAYDAYESKLSKAEVKDDHSRFQRKKLNGTRVQNFDRNGDKSSKRKRY